MSESLPNPEVEQATLYGKTNEQWHDELTGDDLDTPGSRYGRTASDCAWWTVASMHGFIQAGGYVEDDPQLHAEFLMGLAVNDADDIAELVMDHWHELPEEVRAQLVTPEVTV